MRKGDHDDTEKAAVPLLPLGELVGSPTDVISYSMGKTEKGRMGFDLVQSHNRYLQ